jgi:bifunctional ADP-heptose synthase (sugar kinase/adenylyltransferase)
VHLAALPAALQVSILQMLRPPPSQLTVDTIEARGSVGGDLTSYRSSGGFDAVTAFLPSRDEMDVMRGEMTEAAFAFSLRWRDLRFVVVKDGMRGCVVYDRVQRSVHRVPAWPSVAVDPTGAGDAFCGGFMVGLATRADAVEAAVLGTVSASFAVEGLGGMHLLDVEPSRAESRRETLTKEVVHEHP